MKELFITKEELASIGYEVGLKKETRTQKITHTGLLWNTTTTTTEEVFFALFGEWKRRIDKASIAYLDKFRIRFDWAGDIAGLYLPGSWYSETGDEPAELVKAIERHFGRASNKYSIDVAEFTPQGCPCGCGVGSERRVVFASHAEALEALNKEIERLEIARDDAWNKFTGPVPTDPQCWSCGQTE